MKYLGLTISFVIITIVLFVIISPYHFYNFVLLNGVDNDLLKLKPVKQTFFTGNLKELKISSSGLDDLNWRMMHFDHVQIPLPVRSPSYLFYPLIDYNKERTILGLSLLDAKKKQIVKLYVKKGEKFYHSFEDQKIFQLPLFKERLQNIASQKIWDDLFSLQIPHDQFLEDIKELFSFNKTVKNGYIDLIYNLYIISLRNKFFPKTTEKINFYKNRKIGVVELNTIDEQKDKSKKFRKEIIYLKESDQLYQLHLWTYLEDQLAIDFRNRLLKKVRQKDSYPDSSIAIYAIYQNLSYQKKIDQEGLIYLYSAWTHNIDKRGFLKEMIQFLERGSHNQIHLTPLYEYAYKKYGTSFSLIEDKIKETSEEKLKRKIKEEDNREISSIKNNDDNFEDRFKNDQDRIDYHLKEAKSSDFDSDNDENSLITH